MSTYGTVTTNYDPSKHEYNFSGCCCCEYQERDDKGSCLYPLTVLYLPTILPLMYGAFHINDTYRKGEGYMVGYPLLFIAYTVLFCVVKYFTFTTKCNKPFLNGMFEKYNPKDYMCCHFIGVATLASALVINIIWLASIISQSSKDNYLNPNISYV